MSKKLISIVIPCYCSEHSISGVVQEIDEVISKQGTCEYEIILVNDNSKDNTLEVLKNIGHNNHRIAVIDLSKNFGQASAIMAGFHETRGDYVVCMDDDGQMPIESLPDLIVELENGVDVAFGQYEEIQQKWYRNAGSWVNAKMTEILLGKPKNVGMSSFWAAKRYVIDEIMKYDGAFPYVAGLILRITRNIKSIPVKHRAREYGKSGYNFFKLLNLWMNGFTAFSIKPLRFATFCGGMCACAGFVFALVMIIRKILNPNILLGYASIVTLLLFIGGMLMLLLGIMGEYIGRIYICINKAPQYVVKELNDYREG